MTALPLLVEFRDKGIQVRVDGRDLVLSPKTALTTNLVDRIRSEKPTLVSELEKIRKKAGEDWGEIASDPRQLTAFSELLMIADMRRHGVVPDHYTSTTICKHCGPVPIWEGCPPDVLNCPWCFNRIKGLPIPHKSGDDFL